MKENAQKFIYKLNIKKGAESMASLSKEQRQKINNECQNEWELDVHYFLFHNEKTLIKRIQKDDKHCLAHR